MEGRIMVYSRRVRELPTVVMVLAAVAAFGAQPARPIPRGAPVVIDGRADDGEWKDAPRRSSEAGLQVRLQHDRASLFTEHKWVANTTRMSRDRSQEFQIDLKTLSPGARLAMGYYVLAGGGSVLTWPDTLAAGDGCGDLNLVRGSVPASLTFDPSRWTPLSFAP
jgi:hypothetical protein